MKCGEVMMKINNKTFGNFIDELFGVERRISSPECGNIIVLYEDTEIKDIILTDSDIGDVIFGADDATRDVPLFFALKSSPLVEYKYRQPINNSYMNLTTKHDEKYKKLILEPSRFNVIYDNLHPDSSVVFSLMRIRSTDAMPRFLFSYDETRINKAQTEQIIKRILCTCN